MKSHCCTHQNHVNPSTHTVILSAAKDLHETALTFAMKLLKVHDAYVGEIIAAIKEAGIYDDSIIIVTSDHGGIETDHGGWDLNELETPFIIAGKNVKKGGKFSESMMQYDVAGTIAEIFALDTPQVWTSKSMSQVFE